MPVDLAIPDDSYLTVAEAELVAAKQHGLAAWATATDDQKAQALIAATDRVDAQKFQGRRFDASQVRQFPRVPYRGCRDVWAGTWEEPVVPNDVLRAVVLEADFVLGGGLDREQRRQDGRHVASKSEGAVSVTYAGSASSSVGGQLSTRSAGLLERYRLKSGGLV